jgi:GntR family transcriptional regulator/MocR family aminotransferase
LEVGATRVRAGFENALRTAVQTGRLRPQTRLPSTRALAVDLGIARNTVAEAYAQLVAEGWLTARTGSGTWVSDRVPGARPARRAGPTGPPRLRYDLTPGTPDISSFPRTVWAAAARRALAHAPSEAFGYGDERGGSTLRQELASYLARARGVRADPVNIVICAGFIEGLGIITRALKNRGATVVTIEEAGHRLHRDVIADAGMRIRTTPVDADGAHVDRLGDSGAVVLTPAHQFPYGVPLAPERRRAVVRWAAEQAAVVVEDDYDGEFRYDRQAIGALQTLGPDHVIYAGTVSKTLAPGVRLGWLVVPPRLVADVLAAKRVCGGPHGAIDQLTLAELIRSGAYDRHIRQRRLVYRRRREHLATSLRRRAPAVRISGMAAGLHAVLTLPAHLTEQAVVVKAATAGVAIAALGDHHHGRRRPGPAGVVVSYATPPDHDYSRAIARLCAALADLGC